MEVEAMAENDKFNEATRVQMPPKYFAIFGHSYDSPKNEFTLFAK
jgi:hypothetical protein